MSESYSSLKYLFVVSESYSNLKYYFYNGKSVAPTRDEPKSGQALEVLVLPSECDSGAISKKRFLESGDAKSIIF